MFTRSVCDVCFVCSYVLCCAVLGCAGWYVVPYVVLCRIAMWCGIIAPCNVHATCRFMFFQQLPFFGLQSCDGGRFPPTSFQRPCVDSGKALLRRLFFELRISDRVARVCWQNLFLCWIQKGYSIRNGGRRMVKKLENDLCSNNFTI